MTGEDSLICENCGEEMILWEIHIEGYGIIYEELEEIKIGKCESVEFEE